MDITTIIQNLGPLVGILIGGTLAYKLVMSEDAGKAITNKLQKSKVGIADLLLVLFAFLEGLVAANMGEDVLGDTYATRFTNHLVLSMGGAFAGFICIKEVIDASNKSVAKNKDGKSLYSFGYLLVQWLQPLLYFVIAMVMPIFNLMIIAKGCEEKDFTIIMMILGLQDNQYSFAVLINQLSDVAARSLLLVAVHILFTAAVALGSIDESKVEANDKKDNDKKSDDKKKDEDKKDGDSKKPEKVPWVMPGIQKLVDDLSAELKQKDQKYNSVYLLSLINTAAQKQKNENQTEEEVVKKIKKKFLDLHEYLHYNNEGLRIAKSITDEAERTKEFEKHGNNKQKTIANILQLVTELK